MHDRATDQTAVPVLFAIPFGALESSQFASTTGTDSDWIVNKISLAQRDRKNSAARNGSLQSTRDGFDLGKFGHV